MMGIYEICNLHDGKATAYVGSSADIQKRWNSHKSLLRHGAHPNAHLQRAWDAYGEGAFEWGIVEEVEAELDLLAREQYWLDRYLENADMCYNFACWAKAPMKGLKHSEDTKRKMSLARKGNKYALGYCHTVETRRKMGAGHAGAYPALIHRETGEVIPAGMNLRKLCRERGLAENSKGLRKVIAGTRGHHRGWTLLKEEQDESLQDMLLGTPHLRNLGAILTRRTAC